MKAYNLYPAFLLLILSTMLTSCEVVGGIFKAGFWSGIIIVVLIIALVIWLVSRSRK